jgi:hypothetical protein
MRSSQLAQPALSRKTRANEPSLTIIGRRA